MSIIKTFRHEYKFVISFKEMLKLREKLNKLMDIDRSYNGYIVRSLYFDSIENNDYFEKLNGELNRKKIRLRIYESNSKDVKLELKSKYDFHQIKESLIISNDDAMELIKGNYSVLLKYNEELAKRIYVILKSDYYRPKIIIEYLRIAYKSKTTTRITFDLNIKSSDIVYDFFKNNINYVEVSNKSDVVMEIKFDKYLEPYIADILNVCVGRYQSVSKYMLGRNKFEL